MMLTLRNNIVIREKKETEVISKRNKLVRKSVPSILARGVLIL
jgi:hypothetical protein